MTGARFWRASAVLLFVTLGAQGQDLVRQFRETRDVAGKEKLLNQIVQRGSGAGELLLPLAKTTNDRDTRWLAIRGLGMLKFKAAAPFLMESLQSDEPYVRANAARALGELQYAQAGPALIRVLEIEQDGGVLEQASLAVRMVKAVDAIPTLKSRMSFHSAQTRCWLLDAIAGLGAKSEVAFVAKYLYSSAADDQSLPLCAARALATLTGEDFGLPASGGLFDPAVPILKARKWWENQF